MEFTYDDFSDMYYRKQKLHDAVVEIMETVSGTDLKICPYMEDENGRYSEERTQAMVEELLDALKNYLSFERGYETDEVIGRDAEGEALYAFQRYEMPEDEIACYRSFLYCALRLIYANYDYSGGCGEGIFRQVFGDLINMAKNQQVFPSYLAYLRFQYTERLAQFPGILFAFTADSYNDSCGLFVETRNTLASSNGEPSPKDPSPQSVFQEHYMISDEEMEQMLQSLSEEEKEKAERHLREHDEWIKGEAEAEAAYYESGEYDDEEEMLQSM